MSNYAFVIVDLHRGQHGAQKYLNDQMKMHPMDA
jgi:hypothetical protein